MSGAGKIFLETTIQIDRYLETAQRRAQIRTHLLGKQLSSCSYVLMEYQRTVLQDLKYVREMVKSDSEIETDGKVALYELLRKLNRRGGEHGGRKVARSTLMTACIMAHFPEHKVARSELLEFLDYLDEFLWDKFFEADLTQEGGDIHAVECLNQTDCDLIKDHLPKGDRRRYYCRRESASCRLPEFLERHADALEKVRAAFASAGKSGGGPQNPRLAEAAGRILNRQPVDWQMSQGQKNCWPLGDTIIALESPADAEIYTTDRHYDVICPIVGRVRYRERQ